MAEFMCNVGMLDKYIGYYVSREVYDAKPRKLIGINSVITEKLIKSLEGYNVQSIWISKELVDETNKTTFLSDEAQQLTILMGRRKALKETFEEVKNEILYQTKNKNRPIISISQKSLKKVESTVDAILDVIMENPAVAMNLPELNVKDGFFLKHSVNVTYLGLCLISSYPGILDIFRDTEAGLPRFESKTNLLSPLDLVSFGMSCFLHDIGLLPMIHEVAEDKVFNEGDEIWKEIKKHPVFGHDMLFGQGINAHTLLGVKFHHEHIDGSGYPFGVGGYKIHPYSRIIRIIESFDSITTDTPGKSARPFPEALSEILGLSGTRYDPDITKFFVDLVLGGKSGLIKEGQIIK